MTFEDLMDYAISHDCSDVHITQGTNLAVRRYGMLHILDERPTAEEAQEMIYTILTNEEIQKVESGLDVDVGRMIDNGVRIRANVYHQRNNLACSIRLLMAEIPEFEALGLPEVLKTLATANNGIILVTGPTGSGKTTIIDAICLALFNNTARLRTAPASRLTFGAYTLTSRDTSNMLRHGTTDAKAELEFVGNDNNAYTALWTAHATPKNINIAHVLLQNGLEIAKGNQVNTMMKECILGMSFDDFCRTAVLAQGEFTKFLMSDDGTKAEILEKLTATEHFSEVGKTIYAIWKEKDEVKKALQLQIEGIKLLSTEELQEINDTISQAKVGIVGIDKKIDELTKHKNWLLQEATLKLQKEKALQEYHDLESKCHDSVYLEENRLLADYDLSQQAIADLKSRSCLLASVV